MTGHYDCKKVGVGILQWLQHLNTHWGVDILPSEANLLLTRDKKFTWWVKSYMSVPFPPYAQVWECSLPGHTQHWETAMVAWLSQCQMHKCEALLLPTGLVYAPTPHVLPAHYNVPVQPCTQVHTVQDTFHVQWCHQRCFNSHGVTPGLCVSSAKAPLCQQTVCKL